MIGEGETVGADAAVLRRRYLPGKDGHGVAVLVRREQRLEQQAFDKTLDRRGREQRVEGFHILRDGNSQDTRLCPAMPSAWQRSLRAYLGTRGGGKAIEHAYEGRHPLSGAEGLLHGGAGFVPPSVAPCARVWDLLTGPA